MKFHPAKLASLVAFTILCLPTLNAQRKSTLSGRVTSAEGLPIEGAVVSVGALKLSDLKSLDHATTDKDGRFQLAYPGDVIRIRKEGFQPFTLVLDPSSPDITVTLTPEHDSLIAPLCTKSPTRGSRRIGYGPIGATFDIPKKDVEILGGKWDVDYVRYVIRPKRRKGSLEFWFGPYAMSSEPPDEDYLNSLSFEERYLISATGERYGLDVSGIKRDNSRWRRTSIVMTGGALYQNALPEDATLFDRIIDSVCIAPQKR